MKYIVIDIENDTSDISKTFGRKAGSNLLNDAIVSIAYTTGDFNLGGAYQCKYIYPDKLTEFSIDANLLVGHNLQHDLEWLWPLEKFQSWLKTGGEIWDTSVVEYILTGQEAKYCKLRDIAVNKYGCPQREKLMESYWDKGFKTSEIPKNFVIEDNTADIKDTEQVFLFQYEIAKNQKQLNLIKLQMDAVLATFEMKWNGLFIDKYILDENMNNLSKTIHEQEQKILNLIKGYLK